MAIREIITANCENGQLSKSKIARQWDDQGTLIQFAGYPEPETDEELIFRLIVWMRASEDAEPVELPPIELEADQWLISNYYTQLPQMLRFQLCITNEAGTYEKHSPIFSGIVDKSLSHNGEGADIDVIPLFDPYKKYVDELILDAGARVVDTELDETSTHLVENKAVASAVADVNGRLQWYPLAVNVTDGSYVVGSTGGIGTNANLGYSEFSMLPFRGKGIIIQSYLWQGAGYAFLDADGHYITGESANTKGISPANGELTKVETSVPYNAYSLRVSFHKSYTDHSSDYYFRITENKATKYIFIGDSYGTGFNRGGSTTGWIDGAAASIGLKSSDYDKQAKGGSGFCHPSDNVTFTDLLDKSTLDKETVGHIVICGGYNDKQYSETELLAAFETFVAKVREKFPFAEICVGMISHTTNAAEQETIMSTIRLSYMTMCNRDGVRYLSNVEFALSDSDISSIDGVHPDQIGADHLILAVGQALKSGSASILNM